MSPDVSFSLSTSALRKLHAEADLRRISAANLFRKKAWALAVDKDPHFDLNGEERNRDLTIGIPEGNLRRLVSLTERMGVSPDVLGEFVACYDWNGEGA